MIKDSNRDQTRDGMIFPFRWKKSLLDLGDAELRAMLSALFDYGEQGIQPAFTGAMSALWKEYQDRIDFDKEKYENQCEVNRQNALHRWEKEHAKHATACDRMRNDAKHAEGDGEGEGDLKERTLKSSKETAEPFSLTPEPEKRIPFTRWTEQQFREDVERYSDYRDHWEKFISYWTEPDGKGKMRFQKEKTWDTGRRLARWADNQKPVPEEESRNYQRAF